MVLLSPDGISNSCASPSISTGGLDLSCLVLSCRKLPCRCVWPCLKRSIDAWRAAKPTRWGKYAVVGW